MSRQPTDFFKIVKAIRAQFAIRAAIAIMVILTYTVLANYCAISGLFARESLNDAGDMVAAKSQCCESAPGPKEDNPPCPQMPNGCCKTLKIAVPDTAKVPGVTVIVTVAIPLDWWEVIVPAVPDRKTGSPATGPPPDVPGFAELVLQRSLHSHAPPSAA